MGITFDIHALPPTSAEIVTVREQILRDKTALEREDWKVFALIMVVFVSSMVIALVGGRAILKDQTSPTLVTAIVYGFPYGMIVVFGISITFRHRKIEVPKKTMVMALAALENITPEDLATVITWKQQETAIAHYHSNVIAQGRELVRGELDAMRQHLPVAHTTDD